MSIAKLGTLVAAKQTVTDLSQLPPRGMAKEALKNPFRIYSPPDLDEEDEEEKFPTGGLLGAGLVGGGAMALPYMLGSDKKFDAASKGIDSFIAATQRPEGAQSPGYYPDMPENTTVLTAYEDAMSRAAALNPFGVPVGNLLAKGRTSQRIMDAVGMPSYTAKTPRSYLAAKKHYGQFRSGPIPAWYHQVGIKGAALPGEGPAAGTTYADYMLPKFREFWRGKGWGELMPSEINASVMSLDDQANLMREFHASLPADAQAEKARVESGVWGAGTEGNVKNYKGLMDKGHEVRDKMKTVGKVVGGAAGIYALYRLYKYLSAKKKKKREEEESGGAPRGYEWQLRKSAAGAKKGLGRVEKLLKPDVPTPKVKPKVKPKVTAPTPKADVVPDLPLETVPRGTLPAGHVDTPGTPTQFGGREIDAYMSPEQARAVLRGDVEPAWKSREPEKVDRKEIQRQEDEIAKNREIDRILNPGLETIGPNHPLNSPSARAARAASSDAARFAAATAPPKPNPQIDALTASISKIQKRTSAGTLSPEWIAAKQKLDGAHADRFWAEFTAGTKNPAKLRLDQEKVMMKNIITQGSKTPDQDGYGLFRMFAGPDRPDKMSAFRVMAQKAGYQMGEFKFNPSTSTAYAKLVPPKGKIR